jgi:hypothetical protein
MNALDPNATIAIVVVVVVVVIIIVIVVVRNLVLFFFILFYFGSLDLLSMSKMRTMCQMVTTKSDCTRRRTTRPTDGGETT